MTVAERGVPAGKYSYNCDSCSCLLWQRYPIPLPCYLNYHSSILSNNSTIVRSSIALHIWIRLTLYQRIFLPVDVTEPWSRLFFNHWFWICQFLSDVNSFCFRCCCHCFLRSFCFWVRQSLVFVLRGTFFNIQNLSFWWTVMCFQSLFWLSSLLLFIVLLNEF